MKILFHICCSNCAVYPVKLLREEGHHFAGFWFNPNIQPYEEHELRLNSLKVLADRWHIDMFYVDEYRPADYFKMLVDANLIQTDDLDGLTNNSEIVQKFVPPSPERCRVCYTLRLEKTAEEAKRQGFNAFSTTLLISPYQNFEQIVSIAKELEDKHNISFYLRDLRPHFSASKTFARELGLYRQKYCGCVYSREERRKKQDSEKRLKKVKKPVW